MLKNIIAVITASMSLTGCNAGAKEPAVRLSQTVRRPNDPGHKRSPSDDQPGSATATTPSATAPGDTAVPEAGITVT